MGTPQQLDELLGEGSEINIVCHNNPDPDCLASALALGRIAATAGIDERHILYSGEISHQQNRAFVNLLNVDLQPPSYETRYAILRKKIDRASVRIPEEVIELICNNVTSNVRDLESALTKLVAYADLVEKEITPEVAQQQLKDFFASPKQTNITMDIIQRTVADYFNLSSQELKGKKRTKVIAFPRQLAMYIAREITEYSTTEVGLEFGGRDHTTVMHACQRIENRMRTDPTVEPTVQFLVRQIKEQGTKSR